jgi:hypothetical protein
LEQNLFSLFDFFDFAVKILHIWLRAGVAGDPGPGGAGEEAPAQGGRTAAF